MGRLKDMFSEREVKIIKIIGQNNLTLETISSKLFKKGEVPFEPKISVANSIRRIIKKCDHYQLDWSLNKTRENNKLIISKC